MTALSDLGPQPPAPDAHRPILSVEDLRVHFHTDVGVVPAVDGVTFSVAQGETLAVVGESGSGKSVTGMSLLGLLPKPAAKIPTGAIYWRGEDLIGKSESQLRKIRGREIAMIFQDPLTSLNPVMTGGKQIVEMIRLHLDVGRREAKDRALDMLQAVGIPEARRRFDMYPHEFSGGMRQRAMIAMAISCDPALIIADEPTTALDVTVQAQVMDVLAEVQERTGAAMILITHDLGVVAGTADRVMVMYAGRQVETAATDPIFYANRHPYTLGLMASLPRADTDSVLGEGETARLKPIDGQPPSLLHRPTGCAFHPRCELAKLPSPCATDVPELLAVAPGHLSACHFADDLAGRARDAGSQYVEVVELAGFAGVDESAGETAVASPSGPSGVTGVNGEADRG